MTTPAHAASAADSEHADLVARIRRRDTEADTRFYERFGPRVQYLAWRELRSPEHADDVRSEALLRSLQAIRDGRLRSPEALPAFVLQTARNVIQEFVRQNRRLVQLEEFEPQAPPVEPADPGAVRALAMAIDRLGARDRAFLRLHYYEDLPKREIARRLGISEDRVRLVKSRALQRFREAYEEVTAR